MAGADDYIRALLEEEAAQDAFFDRLRQASNARTGETSSLPASSPAVSLMITNRQRAELRERGFSDELIRTMTPAEAHAQLGLAKAKL
jgi:hypothetical protein